MASTTTAGKRSWLAERIPLNPGVSTHLIRIEVVAKPMV